MQTQIETTGNLKTKIFRSKIPGTENCLVLVTDHQIYSNMETVVFTPMIATGKKARFIAEKEGFLEFHEFDNDLTNYLRSKIPLSEEEIRNVNISTVTLDLEEVVADRPAKDDQPMQFRPRNQDFGNDHQI